MFQLRFSRLLGVLLIGLAFAPGFLTGRLCAAPFDRQINFTQPGGTAIQLHARGDEFYAVFETLDGYTVTFDASQNAYCYARPAADGTLASTGAQVGRADPAALGLAKGLRMGADARLAQIAVRRQVWEAGMQIEPRWAEQKARVRAYDEAVERAAVTGAPQPAPPSFTTLGTKVGLTLLVDFSDAPATVPQSSIFEFCNGDAYTGYGNNGSVKQYYWDVSNGMLLYSNVVTIYVRVPQPKTYYNITTNDSGQQANLLIKDALDVLKARPDYTSTILPTFEALTTDASRNVLACNVFYAGGNGGVWSKGLWPHSWSLYNVGAQELSPGGKKIWRYQVSDISTSLSIATFCHENGHMLCGYPDIYDYGYDSSGGAGSFCLMNSGTFDKNPVQICAYLKRASGWTSTLGLTTNSSFVATVGATTTNINRFYRLPKPGSTTEYYLIEGRHKSGRDANLPGSGVLIWQIDELGSRDNQSTNYNSSHLNYECSLIQADNQYHLQRNVNNGDNRDPYYLGNGSSGYSNEFSLATAPSARWWSGTPSGAVFSDFSSIGTTMTFRVGPTQPPLNVALAYVADANGNGLIDYNETNQYWVVLRNDGALAASDVTGTVSTATAQVSMQQSTSAYPDIAPGQTATNLTPFRFVTGAGFPCGGTILFTNLASVPGRTTVNVITQSTGLQFPVARVDNNVSQIIPDLATIYSTNLVSGFTGTVGKVTVSLYLTHTFDGNLTLDLIAPDGAANRLITQRGGSGDNFGTACTPDASRTRLDDAAATAISAGGAAFTGSYRPEQAFTVYNGKSAAVVNGPWTLRITDGAAANTGVLQCWSLEVTPASTCVNGALRPPAVTFNSPTNNQLFVAGESIPIQVSATGLDAGVSNVEIRDGSTVLGTFTGPPYSVTLVNPEQGTHVLTARAVDANSLFATATNVVGVIGQAMRWSGTVSALWSDPFNWTAFRAPTNGEALFFPAGSRVGSTNNTLAVAGAITLEGGFRLGGNWLTVTGGVASAGSNLLALPVRLGAAQPFSSTNGVLQISGNVTNAGYSFICDGSGDTHVQGLISGGGGLTKNGSGTVVLATNQNYTGSTLVNGGTLVLPRGGALGTIRGNVSVYSNATLRTDAADALGTGTSRVNPLTLNGGRLWHNTNGTLSLWGLGLTLYGGTLTATGGPSATLDLGTDSTIGNAATLINAFASVNPSLIAATQVRLRQASTVFNVVDGPADPDLIIAAPILSVTNNSGLIKGGAGTLLLTGSNTFNGTTALNAGTLLVDGSLGTNTVSVSGGGTLGGNGLIRGRVTVSAGTLSPGNGLGRLTVSNAVTLGDKARFEISRAAGVLTNDFLAGVTSLTLGGTLLVTNLGENLAADDTFVLFSANSVTGSFASLSLPPLDNNLAWDTSQLALNGTLRVIGLPYFTVQPGSLAVTNGQPAAFHAVATGTSPLAWQWFKDGAPLGGATDTAISFPAATFADNGAYQVIITNSYGAATSVVATLTVQNPVFVAVPPASLTVTNGDPASFTVSAGGTGPFSFAWRKDGALLLGATDASFNLAAATTNDAGAYDVVVANAASSATSSVATLTVFTPPVFLESPTNVAVVAGSNATFHSLVAGIPAPVLQWFHGTNEVAGEMFPGLTLTNVQSVNAGDYQLIASNLLGVVTSTVATLTIITPPLITHEPTSLTVTNGDPASLVVEAEGGSLNYQWRKSGLDLPDATTAVFSLLAAAVSDVGGYDVVIANLAGSTTSKVATLTVYMAPSIQTNPVGQTVEAGGVATFSLLASGNPAPGYQWRFGGLPLVGATHATLTLSNVQPAQAGSYDAVVANLLGSVTSTPAMLVVNVPLPVITPTLSNGLLTLTWPTGVSGFELQAQTNAPGEGLGTHWFPVSDATNGLWTVPVNPSDGGAFYRLFRP